MSEEKVELAPILSLGGLEIKEIFNASTLWLERHSAYVNSLNVFPVPDGDSGTNMLLTMQAAIKEANTAPDHSAGAVAKALSYGALLGARGNSGVILSQIIRGFSSSIERLETITAKDFAAALVEGSRMAYKGVVKPVEGTILTVVREASDAATISASRNENIRVVLADTIDAARAAVVKTPTLLPVLKEAGVVDAGGQGLLVILEGGYKFLNGEKLESSAGMGGAQSLENISREEGWGFDIQFHVRGSGLDVDAIREKISSMGESALIVGDSTLVKVHVHAPFPGEIIDYGVSLGILSNIILENMQEQYMDFMTQQASPKAATVRAEDLVGIATIAVAPGEGIARVFESLGVSSVISGGQTMNPSTQDILNAIQNARAEQVIILPNNKNIIPAAKQAKELAKKKVEIVPTQTIPQGIAAMIGFNYQNDLAGNTTAMTRAAKNAQTVEITTATRSVSLDGVEVKEGQVIGLIDGTLAGAGEDRVQVTLRMLSKISAQAKEIITVFYGDSVTANEAQIFEEQMRKEFSSQEIEVINGGQPHYHYIISVE